MASEYNFDGIVGPTHNFAGLSYGNVASTAHQGQTSSPRTAVLQGLEKMRLLARRGFCQGVLPPLPRPRVSLLRRLGFRGTTSEVIESAYRADPILVAICYSASNMWTANAATVSPSADTSDRRVHFTPANLSTLLHRAIEADQTHAVLKAIFADPKHFQVHPPLPGCHALSDEGAANHTRLTPQHGHPGLELFVYGRTALSRGNQESLQFPARQTREACQAIARNHQLPAERTLFLQQQPDVIDSGVFHNDVISVGSANLLLIHERALVQCDSVLRDLTERFESLTSSPLHLITVSEQELPVQEAVSSYLFNSQLLQRTDDHFLMVCPFECKTNPFAQSTIARMLEPPDSPIAEVQFLDLRQSMNNGGGPACLRLRVVLTEAESRAMHPGVLWSESLDRQLVAWAEQHFRESLAPSELRDPQLAEESFACLSALAGILSLPEELFVDSAWHGF